MKFTILFPKKETYTDMNNESTIADLYETLEEPEAYELFFRDEKLNPDKKIKEYFNDHIDNVHIYAKSSVRKTDYSPIKMISKFVLVCAIIYTIL